MRNANLFKLIALTLFALACVVFAVLIGTAHGAEPTPDDIWQWEKAKLRLAPTPAPPAPVIRKTILPRIEKPAPKPKYIEGQLSPRGQWRFTSGKWVKVAKAVTFPGATSPDWTFPGGSREDLIHHLLTHAEHRGKWSRAQLEGMSTATLRDLHDADHNSKRAVRVSAPSSNCPDGNCPNTNTRGFGWRLRR
jgi:hypothetical protein